MENIRLQGLQVREAFCPSAAFSKVNMRFCRTGEFMKTIKKINVGWNKLPTQTAKSFQWTTGIDTMPQQPHDSVYAICGGTCTLQSPANVSF